MARSKKQQSKLSFTPLSPDSPASMAQPAATRARAAAVSISPSPKKSTRSQTYLPSPDASSQMRAKPSKKAKTSSSPSSSGPSFMTRSRAPISSPVREVAKPSNANSGIIDLFDDSESEVEPIRKPHHQPSPSLDSMGDDADETMAAPASSAGRRHLKRRANRDSFVDDDDAESHGDEAPAKRRRLKGPRARKQEDPHEQSELKEDLAFLKSDSPEAPGRYMSSQLSAKKSQKMSALEMLKAKRQKAQATPSRSRTVVIDDDDEDENEEEPEQAPAESDEDDLIVVDEDVADYQDANDDSFVVEDEDGDAAQVPMEIKMQVMKPKQLFEFAIEWMCQKRLNPAFAISDDVYTTAFRRLDDFVKGLGGSKYQSSAWGPDFMRAVKARPYIHADRWINNGLIDKCDACRRSRHPPTWLVTFSGTPYDNETLEEDSEEDQNNYQETKLPRANREWYLGKFCMANAKTAHTLAHWRLHLYEWVVEYLEAEGYLDDDEVLKRDRWNTKKKQEYANDVADGMKSRGVTKRLFKDFNGHIEQAQAQNQDDYVLG